MFAHMEDAYTVALTLSAVVIVISAFADGRGLKALAWVISKVAREPAQVPPTATAATASSAAVSHARSASAPRERNNPHAHRPGPATRVHADSGATARDTRELQVTAP